MSIQRIVALAATLALAGPIVPASAQLFPTLDSLSGSLSDSLATDQSQSFHNGLLGKRYLQALYGHGRGRGTSGFTDAFHRFDAMFNSPLPWTDQFVPGLGTDVYVNGSFGVLSDSNSSYSFDVNSYQIEGGLTVYSAFNDSVRPFIQLGVWRSWYEHKFSSMGTTDSFSFDYTSMRVRPGIEVDVSSFLAARAALDVATEVKFKYSRASAELITWLNDSTYLRLGVFVPLEGQHCTLEVGGGISF